MSGPDRERAEKRRLRKGGNWKQGEPYATIPLDWLQAAVQRLSPLGLRVWFLANANWVPSLRDGGRGRAVLGYGMVRHPLGLKSESSRSIQPGHSRIAAAFREAKQLGFLELAVAGSRPSHAGGASGKAAEFFVPCRESGIRPPSLLDKQPWLGGKLRLPNDFMRALAASLSPDALRVLAFVLTLRPRDREGKLLDVTPMLLSATALAEALKMPRSTVAVALKSLTKDRRLSLEAQGMGRRAAQYCLSTVFTGHSRVRTAAPGNIRRHQHALSTHGNIQGVPPVDAKPR